MFHYKLQYQILLFLPYRFKIIDDDIDLSKLRPLDGDELDILGEGEDAPQIAGIIDERPEEVRKMEQFNTTSKWRVINEVLLGNKLNYLVQ